MKPNVWFQRPVTWKNSFARESCGFCTPCRDGLPWAVKALKALENGEGKQEDIDHLQELTRKLWIGKTFCAHAPGNGAAYGRTNISVASLKQKVTNRPAAQASHAEQV